MSLNASTTSVIINSLMTGGIYTARVAGLTRAGSGPFSSPALLNMDPNQLNQLQPRPDPTHNGASVVRETWFLVLIITMIFTIIAALLGTMYMRRRQAMTKQLGHLNVPVGTANDICQLNKVRHSNCIACVNCQLQTTNRLTLFVSGHLMARTRLETNDYTSKFH